MKKNRKANCLVVPVTVGVIAEENDPLFDTAYVLPEQFFPLPRLEQPERKLMFAVLEDAIRCLSYTGYSKSNMYQNPDRLAQEAREWIENDDTLWPFAFLSICEALNLNPDYLRMKFLTQNNGGT